MSEFVAFGAISDHEVPFEHSRQAPMVSSSSSIRGVDRIGIEVARRLVCVDLHIAYTDGAREDDAENRKSIKNLSTLSRVRIFKASHLPLLLQPSTS